MLMGIIVWLIVGGVCGWLASMVMRTDAQQGIILNIIVGIVGAAIAGFLLGGGADLNHGITVTSFLYSLLGAVVLLAIVNLIRRGTNHKTTPDLNRNGRAAQGRRGLFFIVARTPWRARPEASDRQRRSW